MTDKRVIFNDPNEGGKFKVICPSPRRVSELIDGGVTELQAVNFLVDKVIPGNATNRNMINVQDLPPRTNPAKTLNHRDAFEWNDAAQRVIVNLNKVKPL